MKVVISYVDGHELHCTPENWAACRSDGVDWIEVDNVKFQGESIYWLYHENDSWIVGAASFYTNARTKELVIHADGHQMLRAIEWVPDLRHADVKLGWWWSGTEGRTDGIRPENI